MTLKLNYATPRPQKPQPPRHWMRNALIGNVLGFVSFCLLVVFEDDVSNRSLQRVLRFAFYPAEWVLRHLPRGRQVAGEPDFAAIFVVYALYFVVLFTIAAISISELVRWCRGRPTEIHDSSATAKQKTATNATNLHE